MPLNCSILAFAARATTPIKTKKNIMSSVSKAGGRKKAAPKATASATVTRTLSSDKISALETVLGASVEKGDKTKITKDGVETEVDTYLVSIEISKTINASSLSKAADNAVAALGVATKAQLGAISEKVAAEAERGTLTKALKVLDGIVQPAQKASIKI